MGMTNLKRFLTIVFILIFISPTTSSHDASAFTANIKHLDVQPNNIDILLGDSVYWRNLDNRENITHRIVHDSNGDGLYNGTNEWDSGELFAYTSNGTCIDDEGNRTPNCAVSFEVYFNETGDVGTYQYVDMIYLNNTLVENRTFTIVVKPDTHMDAINSYCFGDDCDDDIVEPLSIDSNSNAEKPYWLLFVSGGTGFLALLLGLKMIFSPRNTQFITEESE
ncbi:MAG: hypothetical protein CMB64_07115 [Euryarchaeota archaeon]|nr:hypothetical protein [Euryarchaeota archaeon]